jgi:nucleotide-binding universal stress UspA family protein
MVHQVEKIWIAYHVAGKTWLCVRTHLLKGVPEGEIVLIAEAERVDMIVIGSHAKSNAIQRLPGTVSEGVIRNARQPVPVIRRDV